MTVYAIGDVHGHLDALKGVLALIETDRSATGNHDAPVVQIGDLVDRGPDSKGVVAHLMRLSAEDSRLTVLKGNHDNMFAEFLATPPRHDPRLRRDLSWLHPRLGGRETLASYGIDPDQPEARLQQLAHARVPESHRAFLAALPLSARHDDCLLVHAGIRPGLPLSYQDPADLYWIRDEFLTDTRDHGALVVHGHTPVDTVEHHGNRLAIDTGVAYGGPLSAVAIEGRRAFLLTTRGRQEIPPHAAA
ncbi:serine/threonine protein phosphatase [Rhodobacteraceae bacterium W635]|uniref:metallophosphoesterase family protein n=1 Tax=Nioella halotolerans TaxID=2303578 RepID=UPI000E3CF9D0|nr:serine/threonine protein phosphatase [Rhodobacteraceae bacterium W635]